MFQKYFSSIKEMQTQLFYVLAVAACAASVFGFLLNFALHGNTLPAWVCLFCGVIIFAFSIGGLFASKKEWATIGILITVVWIEFPFLYSVYGNVILIYFVLSILGIAMFFPREFSIPFSVASIIWDVIVIIVTPFIPIDMPEIEGLPLIIFNVCSYLIVGIATFVLLNVLILNYERQKEELYKTNTQLDYLANHDPLTQIYNRGYLMREIDKRMQMDNACFIAIIMDIDNFKMLNDTYGHSFGDKVLAVFAQIMEDEVGEDGFAARFGGEEFMIICDHNNREAALQMLHKIAQRLEEYHQEKYQISVTFSGGLELYSSQKKTDELIINADKKLYEAKRKGKNQIVWE